MKFTVAIDGPAAAGKGTVSRAVAQRFGFAHLDTGLLYRATARRVLDTGMPPAEAAASLAPGDLDGDGLRTQAVADMASRVAVIPEVRQALTAFQRGFAAREGGAVLDGRDIGTVICPEADVKLFVTASAEVRAGRRHAELIASGQEASYEQVLDDVRKRDARDMGRADAPLRPAEDAVIVDTSDLSIEQAVEAACSPIAAKMGHSE